MGEHHSNPPCSGGLCSLPTASVEAHMQTPDSQNLKPIGWCARFPGSLESSQPFSTLHRIGPIQSELCTTTKKTCKVLSSPHINEPRRVKLTK